MKYCVHCGQEMLDEAVVCVKCGRDTTSNMRNNSTDKCQKYCGHCGAEVYSDAVVCLKCGCSVQHTSKSVASSNSETDDILTIIIKVFLIIGCVSQGWLIIPLAWCIPITMSVFKNLRDKQPISMGMKICTTVFVNLIAGVCLLCMNDEKKN